MKTNSPVGIVLSGGQSSRMGKDKGLLKNKTGSEWALFISSILEAVCDDVYISVRSAQKDQYSKFFPSSRLITDVKENIGPAGGIISSTQQFPGRDLFIVSCDMILLDESVIMDIYERFAASPGHDFYGFKTNGEIQPFPGIFSRNLLKNLPENIDNFNYSLVKFLQNKYNNCSDEDFNIKLTSFNSVAELEKCSGINIKKRIKD